MTGPPESSSVSPRRGSSARASPLVAMVVALLVLLTGGWMAFDGARALLVGDYVTPSTGPYAGQLGPWAAVAEAVGIPPRSAAMKGAFVGYGLAYLAALGLFLARHAWGRRALAALAVLGLWYLPFGTICNLLVLAALGLTAEGAAAR